MTSFSNLAENVHLWGYRKYYYHLFPCIKLTEHIKERRRAERLNLSFKSITKELK